MQHTPVEKILIIRLSSIGDVLQCMSIVGGIVAKNPKVEIHWFVRSDIAQIVELDPRIHKIWSFDKKLGFKGLWKFAKDLKKEQFSHIYDAHSNIRSTILKLKLCPFWKRWLGIAPQFTIRSKERLKRILLFKFRINKFPKPFKGMVSFQKPLLRFGITNFPMTPPKWKFSTKSEEKLSKIIPYKLENYICLVPSAAWELKRWDIAYWKRLIELLPSRKFLIIGGPTDTFCAEIAAICPKRAISLAGKSSLMDSCFIVSKTILTVSADTGFIHAADLFGKKGIFLAGPSAFGFPTGTQIITMEKQMNCRPCTKDGRGKCSQKIHKECLMGLSPEMVARKIEEIL